MSVHYKFKSALEYDTVTFDGLHISVKDLKLSIIQQKRIGKNSDFDLQVTNAQTKQIYDDENSLIPKNTSLLIARVPLVVQNKSKNWEGYGHEPVQATRQDDGGPIAKAMDLSSLDASESDKILAMMSQSTQDYDPSNYVKIRGANQVGQVPHNYRCYKCHQAGHWIKDCPLSQGGDNMDIKKSTGIPRSFMVEVEGPQVQGAMMTPYGSFAVPALDHQTYTQKSQPAPLPPVLKVDIPDDLLCSICTDLLTDAVMIPCCGNSFCDECIRSSLLDSEDHECPDCHDRDISPGTLIPNRFLRNSVMTFKNTTGYVKRQVYKPAVINQNLSPERPTVAMPPKEVKGSEPVKEEEEKSSETQADMPAAINNDDTAESTEKTIISEADSTETPKTPVSDGIKEPVPTPVSVDPTVSELPPGVSPTREKTPERPVSVSKQSREEKSSTSRNQPTRYPSETEERSGTPTVDEPGAPPQIPPPMCNGDFQHQPFPTGPPPRMQPAHQHPIPAMHSIGNGQSYDNPPPIHYGPPPQHYAPPPNYRMPPPGHNGYNIYNPPPRPGMYDQPLNGLQGPMIRQQNFYPGQNRPRFGDFPTMNIRTPPGIIDDPLEAFNRMLREKDERERRAKANRKGRSYSRSSSRSFSRSPFHRRRNSRTPRRRTRSRTNSFSLSRSRSRSYSPNHRATSCRDYSPRRRPACRYRTSPHNTSPSSSRYRYKDGPERERMDRGRFNSRDRDRCQDMRPRERERTRERDRGYDAPPKRDELIRDYQQRPPSLLGAGPGPPPGMGPDFHYYDNFNRNREPQRGGGGGIGGGPKWNQGNNRHEYFIPHSNNTPQHHHGDQQGQGPPYHHHMAANGPSMSHQNRFPQQRDYPSNNMNGLPPIAGMFSPPNSNVHNQQTQQPLLPLPFGDVLPPGTDQPLPPGEELPLRYGGHPQQGPGTSRDGHENDRGRTRDRDRPDHAHAMQREKEKDRDRDRERDRDKDRRGHSRDREREHDKPRERETGRDRDRGRDNQKETKEKERSKDRRRSASCSKHEGAVQKKKTTRTDRSKSREEKKKDKDKEKERDRSHSEEEKSKKYKDKKKKRDKKDSEKKKKKDKREKKEHKKEEREHRKEEKDKEKDKNTKLEPTPISTAEENTSNVNVSEEQPGTIPQATVNEVVSTIEEIMENHVELAVLDTIGDMNDDLDKDLPMMDENSKSTYGEPVFEEDITRTSISPVHINPSKVITPEPPAQMKPEDDVLELYTAGELKSELDTEILAPMPEPSKWEVDDDQLLTSDSDSKLDKSCKQVTQDVLKRAENAIFAKAINAIRPIEIKKISVDRAKLYSGEKEKDETASPPTTTIMASKEEQKEKERPKEQSKEREMDKEEISKPAPVRLSVKERLGHKVDDLDRIVRIGHKDNHIRSRTRSPIKRMDGNSNKDRRVIEVDSRNDRRSIVFPEDKNRERDRDRSDRDRDRDRERDRRDRPDRGRDSGKSDARRSSRERDDRRRVDDKLSISNKERFRNRLGERETTDNRENRKRTRSRSRSGSRFHDKNNDRHRKKDKKIKKEKDKEDIDKDRGKERDSNKDKDKDRHRDRRKRSEQETNYKTEKATTTRTTSTLTKPHAKDDDKTSAKEEHSSDVVRDKPVDKSDKRMVDEQDFIPDYDAESEQEPPAPQDEAKRKDTESTRVSTDIIKKRRVESSSNSSSDSSTDNERKRKKHKKHSKKKKRRDSTSSSSSDSSSSDDEQEKTKRRKHKKKSKKKKKSKHKS